MAQEKEHMDTLVDKIAYLREKGYKEDFKIEGKEIQSSEGRMYNPEELKIKEIYRFEGDSNPDDSSDLYAIETDDQLKGILISSRGPNYLDDAELLKKIKVDKPEV